MRKLAAVLALCAIVFCPRVTAAPCPVTPACDPRTEPDRTKCGPRLEGKTDAGRWSGWWWFRAATPSARQWCAFYAVCLNKYCSNVDAGFAIADAIYDAPTIVQGIASALTSYSVVPVKGSQEELDYLTLQYTACMAMYAQPPFAGPWLDAPNCVAPKPPTAQAWRAPPTGTHTYVISTVLNGRPGLPTGRYATPNQLADCTAVHLVNGGLDYCPLAAIPPAQAVLTEVTYVVKAPS